MTHFEYFDRRKAASAYSIYQDENDVWCVAHGDYSVRCESLVDAISLVDTMKDRERAALAS